MTTNPSIFRPSTSPYIAGPKSSSSNIINDNAPQICCYPLKLQLVKNPDNSCRSIGNDVTDLHVGRKKLEYTRVLLVHKDTCKSANSRTKLKLLCLVTKSVTRPLSPLCLISSLGANFCIPYTYTPSADEKEHISIKCISWICHIFLNCSTAYTQNTLCRDNVVPRG